MNSKKSSLPPLGRAERIELRISYSLKILVLFTVIISIIEFNLFLIASAVIILIFSGLPAIIARRLRITLPVEVDLVVTVFIFAHFILGEAADYYNRFWWFDIPLHITSGIIIGMVGFIIIYFFLQMHKIQANPVMVSVFSISFSLAVGALWEIFEFIMDITFNFNMQKTGIVDTMSDLIVDFLGACIVGIGAYRYLKKNEDGIIKSFIHRFIQYNVRLQIKRQERKTQIPKKRLKLKVFHKI